MNENGKKKREWVKTAAIVFLSVMLVLTFFSQTIMSAVREDNNGKFILIVESKRSPLGTRYTASRVDVEVLASDDTQSAISGALYGYEFVITTSTKPVEAGKLVRLANN